MSKAKGSILDRVVIAAPCAQSWDGMEGTQRVRFCRGCSRNVFNISDMTKTEVERFLTENGSSQCTSFFRRSDGTILTDNCPVGLRSARDHFKKLLNFAAGLASLIVAAQSVGAQAPAEVRHPKLRGQIHIVPVAPSEELSPVCAPDPPTQNSLPTPDHPGPGHWLGWHFIPTGDFEEPPVRPTSVPGKASEEKLVRLRATVNADRQALKFYTEACANQAKGKSLVALSYFRQALSSIDRRNCDWKFRELIERDLHDLQQQLNLPITK